MKNYGMFVHYGPNTFKQVAWGDGQFEIENFIVKDLESSAKQWVKAAERAKMDYLVLITKHHDGFCMWDTKWTDYNSHRSPTAIDVVKVVSDECQKRGIKLGLYYSLWDLNYPAYNDDQRYAEYMRKQITELLTNYGAITELWFDGAWDKDYPAGTDKFNSDWEIGITPNYYYGDRWEWKALYELIHDLQPDCEVINNSGFDRAGKIKYLPIDVRTSERTGFVANEKLQNAEPYFDFDQNGNKVELPLEYVMTLNPDWFHTGADRYFQLSVEQIFGLYSKAVEENNRLLLNVGPNSEGKIIDCELEALKSVAKLIEERK